MRSHLSIVSKDASTGNVTSGFKLTALRRIRVSGALLALSAIAALGPCALAPCAQAATLAATQAAVNRADSFLRTVDRGKEVLSYVHFGADYHGHSFVRTVDVNDGVGTFGLVYRFQWEDDGVTDVEFLCTDSGFVYGVAIPYTNAKWSPPFLWANTSIAILGHTLIEAYKDKLSEDDRKQLHALVDKADAKGLLQWSLRFEQLLD